MNISMKNLVMQSGFMVARMGFVNPNINGRITPDLKRRLHRGNHRFANDSVTD